ncbi:MAG: hypothetical protein CMH01_09005 [Marinovum sp.]|nr:hypothetical protein [Marinovum sp.]
MAAPINGPTHCYYLIYSEKVSKMAHRVCNQTELKLFIINDLLRCYFGKAVPKAVHGGLLARCGFPPLRSLAAVRLRVTHAGRRRHCFLTNEWPLLYHG